MTLELSDRQIERQDFVDNTIYELVNELIPSDKEMEWDIETIGEVRDSIKKILVERQICTEPEFYPYITE